MPAAVGVMFTEHVPADSVQVPPGVKATVPVRVAAVPVDVSTTVALQDSDTPIVPVAGQVTVVEVARRPTVTVVVAGVPALWLVSPL